tara:strand:+ start:433 stop:873 length:441 start_codon:yes stop_codon:yes gene_type:complete
MGFLSESNERTLFIRNTALLTCPETPEIDVTSTHASTSTRHHTMSAFATLRAPVVVKTGKASAFARGSSAALPVRARSPSSRRRYPSGLFSDAARGGFIATTRASGRVASSDHRASSARGRAAAVALARAHAVSVSVSDADGPVHP